MPAPRTMPFPCPPTWSPFRAKGWHVQPLAPFLRETPRRPSETLQPANPVPEPEASPECCAQSSRSRWPYRREPLGFPSGTASAPGRPLSHPVRCSRAQSRNGVEWWHLCRATARSTRKLPVAPAARFRGRPRSEEHTSELQSQSNLVCRLLLEKKKKTIQRHLHSKHTALYIQP